MAISCNEIQGEVITWNGQAARNVKIHSGKLTKSIANTSNDVQRTEKSEPLKSDRSDVEILIRDKIWGILLTGNRTPRVPKIRPRPPVEPKTEAENHGRWHVL